MKNLLNKRHGEKKGACFLEGVFQLDEERVVDLDQNIAFVEHCFPEFLF